MDDRTWTDEKNLEWSRGLRRVSLVAELEVDDDDAERARAVFGGVLRRNPVELVARNHPAFLLVCLTATGMTSWEEGTFYAKVAAALRCTKKDAEEVTRYFPRCLDRFGLPRFDEAGGMRWVTPVLLHGGIPLDHLDELLDLAAVRRRRDPSLSGEGFVEWARLNPRALTNQPKALVRFLQYGGEFAPDLVGRVFDYVDERDVSLPRRVRERLAWLAAQGRVVRSADRREARATFGLRDDGAVVVRLPSVQPAAPTRDVEWRVHQGPHTDTFRTTARWTAGPVRTDPLTVEVRAPVRTVTVERDGAASELPLVQADDPLLVFDADGELVPRTRAIPAGTVTLMWPGAVDDAPRGSRGEALTGEDLDVPYGWERWSCREVAVAAGERVCWRQYPAHRVAGADRARVDVGPELDWIRSGDGYKVSTQRPTVELPHSDDPADWVVQVATRDGTVLERIVPGSHTVPLLSTKKPPLSADLMISVKGPLGRGVVRRVVLAEDLEVRSLPPHRRLVPPDGLDRARVEVRQGDRLLGEWAFGPAEVSRSLDVDGLGLVATPPHVALSWVRDGVPGPWTVEPMVLTGEQAHASVVQVRGLQPGVQPSVLFVAGALRHQVNPRGVVGGGARFDLSALSDSVRRSGSGTLFLSTGAEPIRIGAIRPAQLATRVELEHERLDVDSTVSEPLELVVHRLAAPWEPGRVVMTDAGHAPLPAGLRGRGPLRVQVRRADEWSLPSVSVVPASGTDVFDVDQPWYADREDDDVRAVAAILVGAPQTPAAHPSPEALARAIEALSMPHLPAPRNARQALGRLLHQHPATSLEAVRRTTASTPQITQALVAAGLVGTPVADMERPDLVEPLLPRSAVAAMMAASAAVRRHGITDPAAGVQAATLGDCLVDLWCGQPDHLAVGRFEPQFEARPDLPKTAYDFLAPVPTVLLDDESRTIACYQMWQARARLSEAAGFAAPAINRARRAMQHDGLDDALWPHVKHRLSHDGVIALPALSIALALLARAASHGAAGAQQESEAMRPVYSDLARHAPDLVAIDLVRADAAVIGALR